MRNWWIRKRFKKKKPIEVKEEKQAPKYCPIVVKDGKESKDGGGAIEISFEDVEKETDIYFSLRPVEVEEIDLDEGYAIYWFDIDKCVERQEFEIYYGCKNRWARLFDRFFIEEETSYNEKVVMVQHLTGSQ